MSKGNQIDVYVSSNLNNDGYDYFQIQNASNLSGCNIACKLFTSGTRTDTCGFGVSGSSIYNSDSATGECIAERLAGNGFLGLAEWNPPGHLWAQSVCEVNAASITNAPDVQKDTIWTCPGYPNPCTPTTELAYPGPIDSLGDFNYVWVATN